MFRNFNDSNFSQKSAWRKYEQVFKNFISEFLQLVIKIIKNAKIDILNSVSKVICKIETLPTFLFPLTAKNNI